MFRLSTCNAVFAQPASQVGVKAKQGNDSSTTSVSRIDDELAGCCDASTGLGWTELDPSYGE